MSMIPRPCAVVIGHNLPAPHIDMLQALAWGCTMGRDKWWAGARGRLAMWYTCAVAAKKGQFRMATDYDAPRKTEEEMSEDSLEELKSRRNDKNSGKVDEDEVEAAESFELPGADLSHEELTVRVLPRQANEFTCASCFLVKSTSQLAETRGNDKYCVDCV